MAPLIHHIQSVHLHIVLKSLFNLENIKKRKVQISKKRKSIRAGGPTNTGADINTACKAWYDGITWIQRG